MKKKDLGGICCNVRLVSKEQVGRGVEMSGFATIAEVKEAEEEEHSSLAWQSALSGCRVG